MMLTQMMTLMMTVDKDDLNDDDDNNEDHRNDVGEPNNDPGVPIEPVEPACELDDGEAANEPNEDGVACC